MKEADVIEKSIVNSSRRIPQEKIEEVIDRSDIAAVIGEFVKLQKSGKDYKGLSPFTSEKNPSFYVIPSKGIFKDFSSGKGGTLITFLMEHEKLTFPEAVRWLARKCNVELEETEPEDPEADHTREHIFHMNHEACKFFSSQLYKDENAEILEYIKSRFTEDDIVTWQIGIAPDKWTALIDETGSADALLQANLAREKNGRVYDYFRKRIMFPIENSTGNICGFGGRSLPWDKEDQPKYINSPDSPAYNKGKLLYGISRASKEIRNTGICHLVEGYADVIAMHAAGITNSVAPCGTALTEEQIHQLKRLCNKINIVFDGDRAGFEATLRAADLVLHAGMVVLVTRLPEDQDPGSFIKEENAGYIEKNQQYFITWRVAGLLKNTEDDPMARHDALKKIAHSLARIDDSLRNQFIKQICKDYKLEKKDITDLLNENKRDEDHESFGLPKDVDAREFERWGFYDYKNEYYFKTKEGNSKMSNFVMKPLFHVKGTMDQRRIYELKNYTGVREVVSLDMQEMTSLQSFRKHVEGRGNFLFWGTDTQFSKLKQKLYEETKTCIEIKNLGWQKEGFWAWSNGIIIPGQGFLPVDEYGLIAFNSTNYYIAAFSKIYLNDKSIYIDERKFKFRERNEITLHQWASQFILVFGENAQMGIAFWIASLFRDHILHIFKNFPLLNLFGPKGTGKSQMAMSLSCLFGQGQTPFNIHNGTKPGLAEHIQQFINAIAWVDEYKNSLEYDKIETLKSIYDSIGRSRMNLDKGKKKETTLVNSAVILSGQEMPTADVALFSRMIFLRFHKTTFTDDEKNHYDKLKAMENEGLSHLTSEVIKHRDYFEKRYYSIYDLTMRDLLDHLQNQDIEDRIIRNVCSVVSALRTIEDRLNMPFTYKDLLSIAVSIVKTQNDQVGSSNEISKFWNMLESLFQGNTLIDNWDFRIDYDDNILTSDGKRHFDGKYILKFRFNHIAQLYAQNVRKTGDKPLPADTLEYYLKNDKSFIGVARSCRFNKSEYNIELQKVVESSSQTTAFCFDYEKLKINMIREQGIAKESETSNDDDEKQSNMDLMIESKRNDDLPF